MWTFICLAAGAIFVAGCGEQTQHSPALESPLAAPDSAQPPKKGILESAEDATWRVVTIPSRLIPPKAAPKEQPVVSDPPEVTIIRRQYGDDDDSPPPAAATHP